MRSEKLVAQPKTKNLCQVMITSPILSEKETEYSLTWSLVEESPTVDKFELTVKKVSLLPSES